MTENLPNFRSNISVTAILPTLCSFCEKQIGLNYEDTALQSF